MDLKRLYQVLTNSELLFVSGAGLDGISEGKGWSLIGVESLLW